MISLTDFAGKLLKEKKVALIAHVRPDGDTLGSCLALKEALESLGIKADVVCDDSVPSRFFFLNEASLVKGELNGEYSALVAVDCADVSRLGKFAEQFLSHKNTYSIDHHVSNTRYAKVNYVVDNASNAENILALVSALKVNLTKSMANLLAMGIMTDTGNFRHKNVTANTLYSAGKLVESGADLNTIYFYMFSAQTKERAKLFGITMSKIRYFYQGRFAVASVSLSDIEKAGAKADETEGFIDFVMGIIGVEVGACVMETAKNKFKISFRSKGVDVNAVAGTFGGGGHTLASGCQIQGEIEEVIDKIQFAVSRYLPE
ncbi:MAG: bifunctional oligoribonuclease/PAP phosphatase NrnA [Clostridia bacterium]|nr:bifunctional oligoribonuclease/PAP phosphatase NrnA [Clostridia bacterium]MBR3804987.1 bifunctional oligoribonuclease/PAP phosphatase NrnA [Clostridia bacterium]